MTDSFLDNMAALQSMTDREILLLLASEMHHVKATVAASSTRLGDLLQQYQDETSRCPLHPRPNESQPNVCDRLSGVETQISEVKGALKLLRAVAAIAAPGSLWALYQLGNKLIEGMKGG